MAFPEGPKNEERPVIKSGHLISIKCRFFMTSRHVRLNFDFRQAQVCAFCVFYDMTFLLETLRVVIPPGSLPGGPAQCYWWRARLVFLEESDFENSSKKNAENNKKTAEKYLKARSTRSLSMLPPEPALARCRWAADGPWPSLTRP